MLCRTYRSPCFSRFASQRDEERDDLTMNAETFARFFPSVGVCPEEDNGEDDTRGNKNGAL